MDGQSLPFISFTLQDFYFIRSEIIFLTGQRDMLLHTNFGTGGGFVPRSVTKKLVKTWQPSSLPPPPPRQCFMIFLCFSSFLKNRFIWRVLGSFASSNILRKTSENYLSYQTMLMPLSIAGSKQYILCWGEKANLYNREGRTKPGKSRIACKFMCPSTCLWGI